METVNTFTKGLVSDKHPLTIGLDTMTDALNATLITYNGNEMILQNDMGNSRLAVPEFSKQVRLTIYQDTQETTSKGYNTDINTVRDRLSDEDINLRSAFKPIGIVEHGGILYIASLRDIYDENGNKIDTEFEIGSFPGPKIEEPGAVLQEQNYDDVKAWEEVKNKNKIHILYDKDPSTLTKELPIDHLVIFRPGTPIHIYPQLSYPKSLSTPSHRHWYKLKILNLSDNNRDITEELMSCITWDSEGQISWGNEHLDDNPAYFYPNIKNARLGFTIELEDIDSFLLSNIPDTTPEEKEYGGRRLPFLVEPIFDEALKRRYLGNYPEAEGVYYLVINKFNIVQESDVKTDRYRVRYRLTSKDGNFISVDSNNEQVISSSDWNLTIAHRLIREEPTTYISGLPILTDPLNVVIPIGKNKNVSIELEIYPETEDFSFDGDFYPFSNHVIRLNLNLWESPGLWGTSTYLANQSNDFDTVEISKKVWYDMNEEEEDNPKFKFNIPYESKYDITDYFFGCNGHKAKWRTNQNFDGSYYINNNQYQEEKVQGEDTICSIDKLEYIGNGSEVFDTTYYSVNDARIINNRYSDDHPSVFKSALSMRKKAGSLYNLKYFCDSYDVKLDDTISGNALYFINNTIGIITGNQMITYNLRGILLEKCEIGLAVLIENKLVKTHNDIAKSKKPLCMWGFGTDYVAPLQHEGYNGLLNSDSDKQSGELIPKKNSYETYGVNIKDTFNASGFKETPVYIGCYFPALFGVSYMENGGSKIPYHYGLLEDFPENMLMEIGPHIGGKKVSSSIAKEGLYSLFIDTSNHKAKSYLLNKQNDILRPIIYLVIEREGVEYRVSTQNLEHILNNNQSLLNSVESLKNSGFYLRDLDKYLDTSETTSPASFPISSEPYNYLIFKDIEIPWTSAAEGLYLNYYYILQFYFKKNTSNGTLNIAIESNGLSALIDSKGYCLGRELSPCSFNNHNGVTITNDSTLYYTYILIPLTGQNIDIYFNVIGEIEIRNINLLKKVLKNSYYEPKGAVLTFKEDVLLYKKEEEVAPNIYRVVTEIRALGIYLPCFSAQDNSLYYEILTTKNNGTFSLPKEPNSEVLVGNGKVTIDNNEYTIII